MENKSIQYKRSRFSTRLPSDRLYSASHFWLKEAQPGEWRVGFTKFATRILGEPVELDFEVEAQSQVRAGTIVGWIEGFKAVTDLYCPLDGCFSGANPELDEEICLIQNDPYGRGWLYVVDGTPPAECVDADGYAKVLDGAIDDMMGKST